MRDVCERGWKKEGGEKVGSHTEKRKEKKEGALVDGPTYIAGDLPPAFPI